MRTCVGCRTRDLACNLVRVARRSDGSLVFGRDAPGRGAWLCREPATGTAKAACLAVASRRDAFSRALRVPVGPAAVESLRANQLERANMDAGTGVPVSPRRD